MSCKTHRIPGILNLSSIQKARGAQLRVLQERTAGLTRPVDMFLHHTWLLERNDNLDPQELILLSQTFAILVRDQLGGMAGMINMMRMDNLRASQGANYRPDEHDLVDPHTLQEDIKTFNVLKKAFQPKKDQYKGPDNRRDGDGYKNNNYNYNSHSDRNNNRHRNNFRNNNNKERRSRSRSNNDSRSSFHRNSYQRGVTASLAN
jgi:hypothetical protein